ncbi:acyltransferase [Nostoc sp. 3335mG]|nr:acyltransferase [Nostoc sp. 3335mG]
MPFHRRKPFVNPRGPPMPKAADYASIQYLRGFAALCVVVHHLGVQLGRLGGTAMLPEFFASGVDIFFVISGFIMWVTTSRADVTPLAFYRRRLGRIVPLYWFFTTLMVLIALAVPGVLQSARLDFWHVVSSYLFLPSVSPADGTASPLLVPGWTLNYEMFFYAIFGLSLFLPSRARLFAVGGILLGLVVTGVFVQPTQPAMQFWTSSILLEFLFGLAIGATVSNPRLRLAGAPVLAAGLVLIALGLFTLIVPDAWSWGLPRALFFGVPAAMLVLGTVLLDRAGAVETWPLPRLIGDASYSIYLSHGLTLSALGQVWRRLPLDGNPLSLAVFSVVGLVLSVVAGLAVYFAMERPLARALRDRRRPILASA